MTVALKIHVEPLPEGMWADGRRTVAFEEMYRRCHPQLVDLCRRTLCGRGDPEAVAQEAFVRAWVSLDDFSGSRPFWPWVATIARRLCIDQRRRQHREALNMHVAAAVNERPELPPDELLETDEDYRSVMVALKNLKPSEQRVIALRDVNGWSYDEIARFEGVSVESIRGSLKRARASLRRSYAKVAAGAPAFASASMLHRVRARVGRVTSRVRGPGAPYAFSLAGDFAAGAVAVAMGFAATVTPAATTSAASGAAHGLVHVAETGTSVVEPPSGSSADRSGPSLRPGGRPQAQDQAAPRPGALPFLPPDEATAPEDAVFTDFTPSPSYASDGTLFATGVVASGCTYDPCAVLFRSQDRGATWTRLPGSNFTGGTVLLPPEYRNDPRIFAATPAGLMLSDDDGASFSAITAVGGPASISPRFSEDHRILIGQAPGWEYRDDLGAMHPSGMVLGSTSTATMPVFSSDYVRDGTVFIGGTMLDGAGLHRSSVFRCVRAVCEEGAALPGVIGSPSIAVAPDVAENGTVVAWRGEAVYRSADGGRTFARMATPTSGVVRAVTFDPYGRLLVAVQDVQGKKSVGGLFASSDLGTTWQRLGGGTGLDQGVSAVVALADRIVAARAGGSTKGGIACSTDGGITWASRCG